MSAPQSYVPATRKKVNKKTHSQTISSNTAGDTGTVAKLMETKGGGIIALHPEDTLAKAVSILREKRIGALAVLDHAGSLKGILSERDIVRKLAETPGQTLPQTVAENMTPNVVTCAPTDTLVTVLKLMTEGRFRHMPVLDGGTVLGMVTIGDVVQFRLAEVEHEALQLKQMIVG
ncbi:MAG: CBS domain-containing protein [Pseudomonadota bacterium]